MNVFLFRLRIVWVFLCIAAGVLFAAEAQVKAIVPILVTAVAAGAVFIPWRFWYIILALEWIAFCMVGLYTTMSGEFIEMAAIIGPLIAIVGGALHWLASAFISKKE